MKRISYMAFALAIALVALEPAHGKFLQVEETSEVIVSVVNGRVRSSPSLKSEILKEMKVGSRLTYVDENSRWFKVSLSDAGEEQAEKVGWISKTIATKFDSADPDPIFQKIANRYLQRKSLSFKAASQVFEFLQPAADEAKTYETGGDIRLKRFLILSKALGNINFDHANKSPYKEFLTKYDDVVIYHEPAGMWIVRSDRLWELHGRYKKHKVGEEIAWHAARNPLPGECEGYIVCHINYLRVTSGEYLNFYPSGKYAGRALTDIGNMLQPVIADLPEKTTYTTASDISDRAEFNKMLSELRTIISRTPYIEKNRILRQIDLIAEGYR